MRLEEKVFARRKPDFEKLSNFGFRKNKEGYYYSELFMEGDFRAEISVTLDGGIFGRVFETETGEEYVPVYVEQQNGAFVSSVREAYIHVLERIGEACFSKEYFMAKQSNRIAAALFKKYGSIPDFPWKQYTGYGVFRQKAGGKWYALIMGIPKNKLEGETAKDEVEVMNLKADSEDVKRFHQIKGIYPAWHMNKKSWITLLMDDTLRDEDILKLVESSYSLTGKK